MVSIKTNSGGVKLHVGSKAGAYRSTNQVVRAGGRQGVNYEAHFNIPLDKVAGSGPYEAGAPPAPSPSPCQCGTPFTYFGEVSLVPANAETTIVTYTVVGNQIVYLQGFQGCGDADAMYTLYVNNQIVAKSRSSPSNLNAYVNLLSGSPVIQPGITIKLTVTCTLGGVNFYGTLLGYYTTF